MSQLQRRLALIVIAMIATLLFGVIGFVDDYSKMAKQRSLGLTGRQKLLAQLLVLFMAVVQALMQVTYNLVLTVHQTIQQANYKTILVIYRIVAATLMLLALLIIWQFMHDQNKVLQHSQHFSLVIIQAQQQCLLI